MPTPQQQSERTNETILRNLLEHSKDLVYFKDTQGRFIAINEALAKSNRLDSAADAIGKTDFDFFSKEQAERFAADEAHILETGEPLLNKEEFEVLPSGQSVWFSTSKFPLVDDAGKIVGTFGISRDITESMHQLEALKDRENRLAEYHKQTEFELEQASRIHSSLLPKKLHAPQGLSVDFDYRPASSIGGDFFATYDSPYSDSCGLFLCDIMGHGVSAALFTALISSLVETQAKDYLDRPDVMRNRINEGMLNQMPGSYATGVYTYINVHEDGRISLSIANSGHLCPILYRAEDQSVTRLARKKSMALGIMPEKSDLLDYVELKPGDKVFYYTDGITEAANPKDDEFGRERLLDLISNQGHLPPKALIETVNTEVTAFTEGTAATDDRMIILLSVD